MKENILKELRIQIENVIFQFESDYRINNDFENLARSLLSISFTLFFFANITTSNEIQTDTIKVERRIFVGFPSVRHRCQSLGIIFSGSKGSG